MLSTGPGFRNPESMEKYNRGVATLAAAAGLADNVAHVALHHDSMVIDRLAEITCPTLMICGAQDRPVYVTGVRSRKYQQTFYQPRQAVHFFEHASYDIAVLRGSLLRLQGNLAHAAKCG